MVNLNCKEKKWGENGTFKCIKDYIIYFEYNFQNRMIHREHYDTQQIHVSMHRLKHYTHWFKMYQQAHLMDSKCINASSKTLYTLDGFKIYQQAHWFKMYQQTLYVSIHRLKHYTHWFKMYQQAHLMAQLLKLITDTW